MNNVRASTYLGPKKTEVISFLSYEKITKKEKYSVLRLRISGYAGGYPAIINSLSSWYSFGDRVNRYMFIDDKVQLELI